MNNNNLNAIPTPTQAEINQAIASCKWRLEFCGTAICQGMCGPCARTIELGDCDTLKELFGGKEDGLWNTLVKNK